MFSKLGFFRFVAGYDKPIESLRDAIKEHGDVAGSLIVLPEAFNIGRYYWSKGQADHGRAVVADLQSVARDTGTTFVAGLIIRESDGPQTPELPFSSALLIDGVGSVPISRKMDDDGTNEYEPCSTGYDPNNPFLYGDTWIAALICMDSAGKTLAVRERETALAKRLSLKTDGAPQIVCVPACMGSPYDSEGIARKWPNAYFILANCDPSGCKSLIAKKGTTVLPDEPDDDNAVVLWIVT